MAGAWEHVATELVETRYGALVGYATMLTGSRSDAEDIVHDALIAVFGKRRSLANVGAAEGYVRRAIANKFLDRARKGGREKVAFRRVAQESDETVAGPEGAAVDRSSIDQAMALLTPQERACVAMRHMDQLSTREAAVALGISEGSVKRYVYDGVRKLSAAINIEFEAADQEWASVTLKKEGSK
ncbi:MAG: RNA polymerase sigma factor [Demequinaceae bacterium]|nr:RNA polymerase sigma factor [Demequinaceae bacterium]